jgi:hypothetical protein
MQRYEYKVVPAPARGEKTKGIKGTDARFAHALTRLMNSLAADGWEYLRAESLPCEERTGLTRSLTVTQQNLLVFRRELELDDAPYAEAETGLPEEDTFVAPAPGVSPVPPLRPVAAAEPAAYPGYQGGGGLRATHDDGAPRRIVPLGAPGDGRDPSRG